MIIGRVVGNVVATQKNSNLSGKKLLLVMPIDPEEKPTGCVQLVVDAVGAGEGDLVIVIAEGGSARQVVGSENPLAPIDSVIAGIVDEVHSEAGTLKL